MYVCVLCHYCCLVTKSTLTLLRAYGLWPTRLLCPWDFPGNNTRVGCHFLLLGIFSDPGIKLASPALAGKFFTTESPGNSLLCHTVSKILYLFFLTSYLEYFPISLTYVCVCVCVCVCMLNRFSCFQLFATLDCSIPVSSIHGIPQA